MANYLTYNQVVSRGLDTFRKDRCGTRDYVTFLEVSAVTHYMVSENRPLGYIGLAVIENHTIVNEVFMQSEDDIDSLVDHFNFHWDMSAAEKADILSEYCCY